MMQTDKFPFNFFDKGDQRFRELHLTLDTINSELHRNRIEATCNSAQVISSEDEELFWEKGYLGTSSPIVLQRTVFFYVGLHFVLRGVQEQHDLVSTSTMAATDCSLFRHSFVNTIDIYSWFITLVIQSFPMVSYTVVVVPPSI